MQVQLWLNYDMRMLFFESANMLYNGKKYCKKQK